MSVDGCRSWVVASACCFINAVMYGMARLSGVLFVASVPRFNVSREEASFPYTFCSFVRNTSGPLVGYLGHRFGVRPVTLFGCVLGAAGIGCCFFAESITTVTILWGTVFGLGFGLGNILLPVSINQYFDKYRATASGISYSGACLGSFILPPVVELLLNQYGLSGTFLFLAAFVINCIPAALLLKEPVTKEPETQSITGGKKVRMYTVEDPERLKNDLKVSSLTYEERMKRLSTQTILSDYSIRMSSSEPSDFEQIIQNSKGRRRVDPAILEAETISTLSQATDDSEKDDVFSKIVVPEKLPTPHAYYNTAFKKDLEQAGKMHDGSSASFAPSADENPKPISTLETFSVFLDPVFLLVVITNAIYCFTFVCMITVIVDFARDVGVGQSNEKYILMSLSVGDLLGRLSLGSLTDRGYMSRTGFAALCFFSQAIATTAIAWSSGFAMLMGLVAFYGLSEAGLILIFPLIVAQFIAEDKQTVAIPSSNFLAGPLCLAVPPLIGFFRERVGAYDYIFYGIGGISALCGLVYLLLVICPPLEKRSSN